MQVLQITNHEERLAATLRLHYGLHVVPIPQELARLDCLSTQLIQRAKCYQTVVRLGTYTGKVPIYNSLKACKGTMFFLPLPLNKTLATLDEVEQSTSAVCFTKSRVVHYSQWKADQTESGLA